MRRRWVYLFIPLMFAACASLPPAPSHPISSRHTDFTARLIVIDSHSRWQAMLDWHAAKAETGWMRITHAASSRIVELRWQGPKVWLRDNQATSPTAPSPAWRRLKRGELAEHGIPLQPSELATFLLGQRPRGFTTTGERSWAGRRDGSRILVQWRDNRLSVTDATHGRRATLIILRDAPHA